MAYCFLLNIILTLSLNCDVPGDDAENISSSGTDEDDLGLEQKSEG